MTSYWDYLKKNSLLFNKEMYRIFGLVIIVLIPMFISSIVLYVFFEFLFGFPSLYVICISILFTGLVFSLLWMYYIDYKGWFY